MTRFKLSIIALSVIIIVTILFKLWLLIPVAALLFLIATFFGVYLIQWNYFIKSVNRIATHEKKVLLTFDDAPQDVHTEKVLDILKVKNVKAVFFLIGKNIEGREHIVRRMIQEGHTIGNHSYSHVNSFPLWNTKTVINDIEKADAKLKSLNIDTKLFRIPFGLSNPNIASAIKAKGLTSIGWSLRTFDTMSKSKENLVKKVLNNVKSGDIILMHEWGKFTADALPEIIDGIREKGLDFGILNSGSIS